MGDLSAAAGTGATIGELTDLHIKTVSPDTPLIDALMLITDKQYVVPVVDKDNKLLGAISFFSVLYGLKEEYGRETVQQAKEKEREKRELRRTHRFMVILAIAFLVVPFVINDYLERAGQKREGKN